MKLALMAITDGRRSCLEHTLAAFTANVDGLLLDQQIIVNDAVGDDEFIDWVDELGFDEHVKPATQRRGFAGAIQTGWDHLDDDVTHVVHLEDDFLLNRAWDLEAVTRVLDEHPHIAQMALRRQAWSEPELRAGGIVEMWPREYLDCDDGDGHQWLEQRLFFTTNPSVYPIRITRDGWPQQDGSEAAFTQRLLADATNVFAYWGAREDEPWVLHIGEHRVGIGY